MCLLLTCKSGDWLFNSAASGNVGEEKNWTIQTAHPQHFVLFWIGSSDQQREKKHVDTCIGVHAHTHTHTHTDVRTHPGSCPRIPCLPGIDERMPFSDNTVPGAMWGGWGWAAGSDSCPQAACRQTQGHFTIRASHVITTTVIETRALQKHGHLDTKETGKSCSQVIILNDWDLDRWRRGEKHISRRGRQPGRGIESRWWKTLNIMLRSLSFVWSNIGGHQSVNSPGLLFIICLFLDPFPFYKTMHLVTQDCLPYTEIQTLPPNLPNQLLTFHFSSGVFESFISVF